MKPKAIESMVGFGLRPHHYTFCHNQEKLPPLEIISCNYAMIKGGPALYHLDKIIQKSHCLMHGVSLDIGGFEKLDLEYIKSLSQLGRRTNARVISDHLCFTKSKVHHSYDLLPIVKNESNLRRISERVLRVQDMLKRPLTLENISTYIQFAQDELTEVGFIAELCKLTGCKALLDINNVYVCAINHCYSPWQEILKLRSEDIVQYHLAGHEVQALCLVDTHAEDICDEVWTLFQKTIHHHGMRYTIIERDDEDEPIETVLYERKTALDLILQAASNKAPSTQFSLSI